MNYYPFHIGDYRSATNFLSNEEDLAYRRLLDMYYDTEQLIPLDTQWVSRRLRVGTDALETVLNDFFVKDESGYRHARCDAEIAEYNRKADIARENGKKGGRRKAAQNLEKNPSGSKLVSSGNQEPAQSLANQEPRTKNQKRYSSPDGAGNLFDTFWKAYPKKVAKEVAAKAFAKLRPSQEMLDEMLAAIAIQKATPQWTSVQFIPNPATWLNQARWQDEVDGNTGTENLFAGAI